MSHHSIFQLNSYVFFLNMWNKNVCHFKQPLSTAHTTQYSNGHSSYSSGLAPISSHGSLGLGSQSSGGSLSLGSSYSVGHGSQTVNSFGGNSFGGSSFGGGSFGGNSFGGSSFGGGFPSDGLQGKKIHWLFYMFFFSYSYSWGLIQFQMCWIRNSVQFRHNEWIKKTLKFILQ